MNIKHRKVKCEIYYLPLFVINNKIQTRVITSRKNLIKFINTDTMALILK